MHLGASSICATLAAVPLVFPVGLAAAGAFLTAGLGVVVAVLPLSLSNARERSPCRPSRRLAQSEPFVLAATLVRQEAGPLSTSSHSNCITSHNILCVVLSRHPCARSTRVVRHSGCSHSGGRSSASLAMLVSARSP